MGGLVGNYFGPEVPKSMIDLALEMTGPIFLYNLGRASDSQ